MSHDLQMARGAGDGEYNLAIGEPFLVQALFLNQVMIKGGAPKALTYPRVGGEPELIEELRRHQPQYKYFVITSGAKQAIEAAFFAFRRLERCSDVYHRAPYWPSYPTLAKNQGLSFNTATPREATIFCVTSPNNPDGDQEHLYKSAPEIWDAAYAQPLYGFFGIPPPHRVAIYSAAKYLGLSGLRVGWFATDEEELAQQAAYFVEIATSGVSIPSQMHLLGCLKALRDPDQMTRLTQASMEARAALMANGNTFNELLSDLVTGVKGVPRDGSGMFAWFQARWPDQFAKALVAAKVKLVTGEACGEYRKGWYRMSMGQLPEITREALQKLRRSYLSQRST